MKKLNQIKLSKTGIFSTVFGGLLIGLPTIPLAATAQTSQVLNPCPKIYYEEPFNSRNLVPEGCPPNKATQEYRAASGATNPISLNQQPSDTVSGQNLPTEPGANLTPNAVVPADAPTTPAQVAPTPRQPGIVTRPGTPGVTNPPGTATTPPVKPPLPENRSQPVAAVMTMNGTINVKLKNNTNAVVTYDAIGYTGRRTLPGGEEIVLRNLPVPVTITTVRQDNGLVDVTPMSSQEGLLEVSLNESKNLDDNAGVLRIQKDGQVFLN